MKDFNKIDFSQGKTSKNLMQLFIPLLIAFFFNMAFDINDSLWIGNLLGEQALAAQTISMPIILLFNSICMGATAGIAIILSQYIGAKKQEKIAETISTSFVAALAFVFIVTIACELGLNQILNVLQTPPEIYQMAKEFLAIHLISFPFAMLYMYFSAILRSYGNSIIQLIAIIICTLFNAVLDPIFIYYMGMNGVAIATVLSEGIMMIFVFVYCTRNHIFKINFHAFRFSALNDIISKAFTSAVQQSLPAISTSFITSLVAIYGTIPLAGFGTATKIEIILLYPPMALNMALTSITGQCFGAKFQEKAKEYLKCGILVGSSILIVFTLLVTIFSRELAWMFGSSEVVSEIVVGYFLIIGVGYVCNAITNCILGTINGFGKPILAMLIMIFYYVIVRMPLAKILSMTDLKLNGIWIAVLISHIMATIASIFYYQISLKKEMNKRLEQTEVVSL